MKKLTVVMRSDLGMRTGKMASQAGHAAMKVLMSHMRSGKDGLRLSGPKMTELRKFLAAPEIDFKFAESEEAVRVFLGLADDSQVVIDNGLTKFNGVKTVTCAASGLFNAAWTDAPYDCLETESDRKAKQYFVFSRAKKLKKEVACTLAALGCLNQIAKMLDFDSQALRDEYLISSGTNIAFDSWIKSGYAKISLSIANDASLYELQDKLDMRGSTTSLVEFEGVKMLAIGPEFHANIEHLTGDLKLV